VGFWAALVVVSPKFQRYEYGGVPPLADAENETSNGGAPDVEVVAIAVTARREVVTLEATILTALLVAVDCKASVTVTVTK
jgi:hypothetical protein